MNLDDKEDFAFAVVVTNALDDALPQFTDEELNHPDVEAAVDLCPDDFIDRLVNGELDDNPDKEKTPRRVNRGN